MPDLYNSNIELHHSELKSPKQGLYLFYADWCPHCNDPHFVQTWENVHKSLNGKRAVKALNCAKDENRTVCSSVGVTGFPTIMRVNSSGEFEAYKGPREESALIAFANGSKQSGGSRRLSRRRSRKTSRRQSRRSSRRRSRRSRRRSSRRRSRRSRIRSRRASRR